MINIYEIDPGRTDWTPGHTPTLDVIQNAAFLISEDNHEKALSKFIQIINNGYSIDESYFFIQNTEDDEIK